MVSHGFISGALFLCVGVIYDRMHTREVAAYGGLVARMPVYATIFLFFTMGNVGLPGTSGFIGEFLTLAGTFQVNTWAAMVAATGVILSAGYALWLYKRVVFGEMTKPALKAIADLDRRETLIFAPLVAGTLILGVYPAALTDLFGPAAEALVQGVQQDIAAWRDGVALALN
jgi:NADH-quinone oxidoreductase subunit M